MSCFPCFSSKKEETNEDNSNIPVAEVKDAPAPAPVAPVNTQKAQPPAEATTNKAETTPKKAAATTKNAESSDSSDDDDDDPVILNEDDSAQSFTFREMAMATKNFKQECLLGESGFGRVFKGTLQSSGQIVAVRQLDRTGAHGSKEFLDDALALSKLHHQNLVSLIGYCADGDQRILVYDYIPSGSLEQHLFDISAGKKPLDWNVRMKIALGVAEGLEYLHEKANPPIIYRDLKSADIMLDEQYKPKLSGYGLAKIVQSGNKMNVSPRVVAGYGYSAPEYERHGELTFKSDVYSFGVVLLELITGRRAFDPTRPAAEQNLVSWAQPFFRDPKKFPDMADPFLENRFATMSLSQAVGAAAMCLQDEPSVRPLISDVVAALSFLAMAPPDATVPARLVPLLSTRVDTVTQPEDNNFLNEDHLNNKQPQEHEDDDEDDDDKSSSDYEDSEDNKEAEAKAELQYESSRKSRSSSASSNSDGSRDESPRFSLRESSFRHGSGSASPNPTHEDVKQYHHDGDDSSSEDES